MIEPEVIWHTLCTVVDLSDDVRNGSTSRFFLISRLADGVGVQLNYKCETCGAFISVNFPVEGS